MARVSCLGFFPFCITPTDDSTLVGQDTNYPFGFTLEDAMSLFWKTKSFSISITGTSVLQYPDQPINETDTLSYNDEYQQYDSEPYLVCSGGYNEYLQNVVGGTREFSDGSSADLYIDTRFTCFVAGAYLQSPSNIYLYDNLYYPELFFRLTLYTTDGVDVVTNKNWEGAPDDYPYNAGTFYFLDQQCPLYAGQVPAQTTNLEITISVGEEWPYNP